MSRRCVALTEGVGFVHRTCIFISKACSIVQYTGGIIAAWHEGKEWSALSPSDGELDLSAAPLQILVVCGAADYSVPPQTSASRRSS
jgi:hypothetical protein